MSKDPARSPFTRDDERWLRSIKITPADVSRDTVLAARPDIHISAVLAELITAMYGEVNFETWLAYRTNAGVIKTGRTPRGIMNWRSDSKRDNRER